MKPFDLLILFHRFEFTFFQKKLFISILSKLPTEGTKSRYIFQFKARDMMVDVEPKMTYEQLQIETYQLTNRIYQIDEPKRLLQVSLLSSTSFLKGTGVVEVVLSRAILPYLLILRKSYRLQILNHVLGFKSIYSIKIYLTLLKKDGNDSMKWNIEQLKTHLDNNYKDYNTFKKRIILQAQKELHLTDMAFIFQEEKIGRKIENIILETLSIAQLYVTKEEQFLIKKLMKQLEITEHQAKRIVLKFTLEEIQLITYNILEKYRSGQVKSNLGAYTVGLFNNLI